MKWYGSIEGEELSPEEARRWAVYWGGEEAVMDEEAGIDTGRFALGRPYHAAGGELELFLLRDFEE